MRGFAFNLRQQVALHRARSLTATLRRQTDVRYILLRDIPLRAIGALPEDASGAAATWAPRDRDFPPGTTCGVWKPDGTADNDNAKLRKGFCQRDQSSAWIFSINGQRFPTMTVKGGRNLLVRLGNLSSSVGN